MSDIPIVVSCQLGMGMSRLSANPCYVYRKAWSRTLARGICRTKIEKTGTEYARVDYGSSGVSNVPRSIYDRHEYKPPFDELPRCEELDVA